MGNISSRPDDGAVLYLKDQARCMQPSLLLGNAPLTLPVSLNSLVISNGRQKVLLSVSPNAYPASRLVGRPDAVDYRPISFVQVSFAECH